MNSTRRVILVGAGHAHLHTLQHAAEFARRGVELVVIAPEDFWYSGLATGVLGGRYPPEMDQVDIAALLGAGRFVRERVVKIDAAARRVHLSGGEVLGFDALSVNVGSEVWPIPGAADGVIPIKPLHELARLRRELEAARDARRAVHIVVAGGGPSGCEIATNVRALMGGGSAKITLLVRGARVVAGFAPRVSARLHDWLRTCDIAVQFDSELERIDARTAVTTRGDAIHFDYLVNATGLHPPALLVESGLTCSEQGELLVDEHLRTLSGAPIFGGGDCVKMKDHDLEKIGVYAVRQSPVLLRNLLATLDGTPLHAFVPQRHCLLILNLGSGLGLARWHGFYWFGRAAFWLKDRIDRRFLARYPRPLP